MLLNVRLGEQEERIVRGLRRARVNVSELVRRAIRESAPSASGVKKRSQLLDEILRDHPDDSAESHPPLDDRRALSAAIRRQLRKKK